MKLRAGYLRARAGGRGVLLAVSGGGDSMALLDATAVLAPELRLSCEVACINHQLRSQAPSEVALVEREARARKLPFHTAAIALAPGPGIEARARDARYDALQRIRAEAGLELLATAHTATDQAETVLMRLARGTSLSGAAGVRAVRGSVIRPMLACTREEVRAYLLRRQIPFAEDPMNADPAFLRSRIRSEALPALERAAGPGASERLAHFAELAAEDSELLDVWAEAASRRLRLPDGSLDAVGLRLVERPLRRRILARLMTSAGLAMDFDLIARAEEALEGEHQGATLPGGAVLRATGGRVRIRDAEPKQAGTGRRTRIELDGAPVPVGEYGRHLRWASTSDDPRAQPISASAQGVLWVRSRARGDRVLLPSGRTRKLQDVLTDARVPREDRDRLIVLEDKDGFVVCVVGVWPRRGARTRSARGGWLVDVPLAAERAAVGLPLSYKGSPEGR